MKTEDDTRKLAIPVVRYQVTHHCGECSLSPVLEFERASEDWGGEVFTVYHCPNCHTEYRLGSNPTYEIEPPETASSATRL